MEKKRDLNNTHDDDEGGYLEVSRINSVIRVAYPPWLAWRDSTTWRSVRVLNNFNLYLRNYRIETKKRSYSGRLIPQISHALAYTTTPTPKMKHSTSTRNKETI